MRTPAGKECRYFYGDYYRGRNNEECLLLKSTNPPLPWKAELCSSCPVPEILMANACTNMEFSARLDRPFPFTKQKVGIIPVCRKTGKTGFDPHVGCGNCTELPDIFSKFETS
jgi:hypothetical protein